MLVNAVPGIVDRIAAIVDGFDAGIPLDEAGEDLLIAALAPGSLPEASVAAIPVERSTSHSVRLNVDLPDHMMSGISDMVLARNELARGLRDGDIDPKVEAALERLSLTVADMHDTVREPGCKTSRRRSLYCRGWYAIPARSCARR